MPLFSLDVGDEDEHPLLEDEDFFKPESIVPGTVPELNPETVLIAQDPKDPEESVRIDASENAPSRIQEAAKVDQAIADLTKQGTLDQVSMESLNNFLPGANLLPATYCTAYPSKIHYEATLSRLKQYKKTVS